MGQQLYLVGPLCTTAAIECVGYLLIAVVTLCAPSPSAHQTFSSRVSAKQKCCLKKCEGVVVWKTIWKSIFNVNSFFDQPTITGLHFNIVL